MAFTTSNLVRTVFGDRSVIMGTYASTGGSTGGTISTSLEGISYANASSATSTPSVQVSVSGGNVTLTTTANQTGTFMVVGK